MTFRWFFKGVVGKVHASVDRLRTAIERSLARRRLRVRPHRTRRLLSQFVGEGSLVFDVGANVGDRTSLFRQLGARVVAVEPQPRCVEALQRRFSGDDSVSIVASGVADTAGSLELRICRDQPGLSSMSARWREVRFPNVTWDPPIEVPVTTLDSLIREYGVPDFCKIDVEGLERQVLAGLSRSLPALSFEFVGIFLDETRRCLELLSRLGVVEANFSLYEEGRLALDAWLSSDQVLGELRRRALEDQTLSGDVYVRFSSESLSKIPSS